MSTKIYDGFRVDNINTMSGLGLWIKQFRGKADLKLSELVTKHIAERSTEIIDYLTVYSIEEVVKKLDFGFNFLGCSPLTASQMNLWSEEKKPQQERLFDFYCELQMFPMEGNTMLGIMFSSHYREFEGVLESMPGYSEYGYWNNTDRPSKISQKKWNQRRDDWDNAIGYAPVANYGFGVNCRYHSLPKKEQVILNIPSLADRTKALAMAIVYDEKIREMEESNKEESFSEYLHWMGSKDHISKINAKKKELKKILLKDISMDTLFTEIGVLKAQLEDREKR